MIQIIQSKLWFQFGIALGFLLPPIFIHDHENKDEIAQDIDNFFYYVGGIMTAFSLLTILCKCLIESNQSRSIHFGCSLQGKAASAADAGAFRTAGRAQ